MNLIELFTMIENKISLGNSLKDCADILNLYNSKDYAQYVKKNKNKYNRKVVISNKKMELVVITWSKGQSSGYHRHPGECIFKIIENSILEEKKCKDTNINHIYNTGDIGYIDNSIGIHNMIAMSDAVTLHIYSPPF
jgi:hypothetical protein